MNRCCYVAQEILHRIQESKNLLSVSLLFCVISLIRKRKVYYLVAIRKSLNGLSVIGVIYGLYTLDVLYNWDGSS